MDFEHRYTWVWITLFRFLADWVWLITYLRFFSISDKTDFNFYLKPMLGILNKIMSNSSACCLEHGKWLISAHYWYYKEHHTGKRSGNMSDCCGSWGGSQPFSLKISQHTFSRDRNNFPQNLPFGKYSIYWLWELP